MDIIQTGDKNELIARLKDIYLDGPKGSELLPEKWSVDKIREALRDRWERDRGDRDEILSRLKKCEYTPADPKPRVKTFPNGTN